MKTRGFKLMGSLVVALLVSAIVVTSALAAPPTPTQPGTPSWGYGGFGMMGGYELGRVAKLLGVTTSDIVTQLRQGKTLVEIATGKATEQELIDLLIAPNADQLKLRVKYEYITQEQADYLLGQAIERTKTAINTSWSTGSNGQGGFWGPMHGGFGGMMGGLGGMMGVFGGMMGGFGGPTGGFGGMMGGWGR